MKTKVLVVDGSALMPWLVRSLVSDEVEVQHVDSFSAARVVLRKNPPSVAIFNITPSQLPWRELADLCQKHHPPIPVLWSSSVFSSLEDAGYVDRRGHGQLQDSQEDPFFVAKPCAAKDLRRWLKTILESLEDVGDELAN